MALVTLLIVGAGIAGAAAITSLVMGRKDGPKPTRPAPAAKAEREPERGDEHEIVELHPGRSLAEQLQHHAAEAEARGLRPFFELGAAWCPPSRIFGESLHDPRIAAALAGTYLIRADMDDFSDDPLPLDWRLSSVPVFVELDAAGERTGRQIDGGAWGEDTIDNMAQTLAPFLA